MKYKHVPVSSELWIPVPENLTPEEETDFIASRIAFVNLEQLEADCRNAAKALGRRQNDSDGKRPCRFVENP